MIVQVAACQIGKLGIILRSRRIVLRHRTLKHPKIITIEFFASRKYIILTRLVLIAPKAFNESSIQKEIKSATRYKIYFSLLKNTYRGYTTRKQHLII